MHLVNNSDDSISYRTKCYIPIQRNRVPANPATGHAIRLAPKLEKTVNDATAIKDDDIVYKFSFIVFVFKLLIYLWRKPLATRSTNPCVGSLYKFVS